MSIEEGPPEAQPSTAPSLQFDRAEAVTPSSLTCTECRQAVKGEYFKINEQVLCGTCNKKYDNSSTGGMGRFIRACIFGTIGAVIGSAIYYAVLALTGLQVGLISILIGIIVGKAVHNGSGRKGGWVYQCLAIFLTYTAIVSSFVPLIVAEARKQHENMPALKVSSKRAVASESNDDSSAQTAGSDSTASPAPNPPKPTFGELIKLLFVLIGLIYAIPFLGGVDNAIGLFIIGIGLWEAWKINTRIRRHVAGPFFLNAQTVSSESSASA